MKVSMTRVYTYRGPGMGGGVRKLLTLRRKQGPDHGKPDQKSIFKVCSPNF